MENKPRLLTVTQFAKEKGISITTIHKWVREGKVKGLISDHPKRYKDSSPIASEEEARERYDNMSRTSHRKVKFSYDELKKMLEEDRTYQEIADMTGVSRQAIEQIHSKYFAFFIPPARERQKERAKKNRERKINNHFETVDSWSILGKLAAKVGFEVKPIPTKGTSATSRTTVVLINGKRCGFHHLKIAAKTHKRGHRLYYRTELTRKNLSDTEVTILVTGKRNPNIFIIPSEFLLDEIFGGSTKNQQMIFIPTEYQSVYNNKYPRVDWFSYENAWSCLE